MKSVFKRAGLTALSVVTAAGLAAGGAQAGDTIKIGSFLAVTGGASFLGDPEKKTLEMYVDKINADGGVLGKQLELIVYDSGGSPKKSGPFAKRLINDDKVDILLAGSTTGATMAVIPIVEKAGIPFISFGGAGVIINPVKKWVFKTPHTDTLAVKKIYTDMKARGISKVGLLSGSGGFDKSCRKNVLALAADFTNRATGNFDIVFVNDLDLDTGDGDAGGFDFAGQRSFLDHTVGRQRGQHRTGLGLAINMMELGVGDDLQSCLQDRLGHGRGAEEDMADAA